MGIQAIFQNIALIIAGVISLGGLAGLAGLIWKVSKWHSAVVDQNSLILSNQNVMFKKVEIIEGQIQTIANVVGYQFQKNGGGSTTDKIDRIEMAILEVTDRLMIDFYLDSQPKYECDSNGHCISVNNKFKELTGLSENDALGHGWLKAIHPRHQEKVYNKWELFIQKELDFECEYEVVNAFTQTTYLVRGKAVQKKKNKEEPIIIGTFEVLKTIKNEKNNRLATG